MSTKKIQPYILQFLNLLYLLTIYVDIVVFNSHHTPPPNSPCFILAKKWPTSKYNTGEIVPQKNPKKDKFKIHGLWFSQLNGRSYKVPLKNNGFRKLTTKELPTFL